MSFFVPALRFACLASLPTLQLPTLQLLPCGQGRQGESSCEECETKNKFAGRLVANLLFRRAAAVVSLVHRSKLVPDFALSTHGVHLAMCWFYTGLLPRNMMWWVCMGASSAICIALGVWGCRYRELQPMSFGGNAGGARASENVGNNAPAEEEDVGFSRGRGRGRGRDGAGTYEMVGMGEGTKQDVPDTDV